MFLVALAVATTVLFLWCVLDTNGPRPPGAVA